MSSSLTRMTAFWPPDDPLVLSRMALEGRASRFHCCLANGRLRRTSPVGGRRGDGLLTEQIADARGYCRELVKMPHTCRSRYPPGSAQLGGLRTFARDSADASTVVLDTGNVTRSRSKKG